MTEEKTKTAATANIPANSQEIVAVPFAAFGGAADKTYTNIVESVETTIIRATYDSSQQGPMMVNVEYDAARAKQRIENLRANRPRGQTVNTNSSG